MHDHGERVANVAVEKNIEFNKLTPLVADKLVIEAGIAARARFDLVEKVVDDLVEGQRIQEFDPLFIEIGHILEHTALILAQIHDRTDVFGRRINFDLDDRLLHVFDIRLLGQMRRVIDKKFLPVRLMHLIGDARRGGDDVEIEFPLDAFLNDFHVQKPQKAAAKTEPERDGGIRLEDERRVIELQF